MIYLNDMKQNKTGAEREEGGTTMHAFLPEKLLLHHTRLQGAKEKKRLLLA